MLDIPSYILGKKAGGREGGTSNYNELSNKPSINDVTLSGNKTTADLGIEIPSIATSISDTSTNTEVAGAKAVYDNSLDVYSTTEQRVGTWIDGKPIYRKIFDCGNLPASNNGKDINFDISISNIIKADLMINSPQWFLATPSNYNQYMFGSLKIACRIDKNDKSIQLRCTDGSMSVSNDYQVYVIIDYTKTTD